MTQYTLRNVPPVVDSALRRRARLEHKSLNQLTIELLVMALGTDTVPARQRSLECISGSWHDDPDTERALIDQRRIDPEVWR